MKLSEVTTWRDAVCVVIDGFTSKNKCFSSGEVTKVIREERPDLHFSHFDVGEYVRDLYYSGSIKYLHNFGGVEEDRDAYQFPRITEGKSRTPSGQKVFVYGPTIDETLEYDFEVEIPRSKASHDSSYQKYGELKNEEDDSKHIHATVHADGRLCIPRGAFDEYMHKTGRSLSLGDKVYIKQEKDQIVVNFEPTQDSKEYDITRDRGRVKYKPKKLSSIIDDIISFHAGDMYEIDVEDEAIRVDLRQKVPA